MKTQRSAPGLLPSLAAALALAASCAEHAAATPTPAEQAADARQGVEQALASAQQDKRGLVLYVAGQVIAGAVVRIEPGQWVELRNQQHSRILVRLDRIDAVAAP